MVLILFLGIFPACDMWLSLCSVVFWQHLKAGTYHGCHSRCAYPVTLGRRSDGVFPWFSTAFGCRWSWRISWTNCWAMLSPKGTRENSFKRSFCRTLEGLACTFVNSCWRNWNSASDHRPVSPCFVCTTHIYCVIIAMDACHKVVRNTRVLQRWYCINNRDHSTVG